MLGGDPDQLAVKYMGDMARICHITPMELPEMRLRDFAHLAIYIDHRLEIEKHQMQQMMRGGGHDA